MKADNRLKGIIFDIQKFCLHDGPGIRSTIFFKGCNLHCQWCHNPESISPERQLSFNSSSCVLCGACVSVCTNQVHEITGNGHEVHFERCTSCGSCVDSCLPDALKIIGREITIEEILFELEKDRKYYETSGGGVTLSGGECTLQFEFILPLLKELKIRNIHTCIETNGMIPEKRLSELISFTDLFLFDYKLTDEVQHKQHTGTGNARVLENLKLLDSLEAKVILRCPIIPGINDTEHHLKRISELSKTYHCIQYIEIMAYHSIGRDKWKQIGRETCFFDLETVPASKVEEWKEFIRKDGGNI